MEFIEKLPLVKLHYLLSLKFSEYKQYDKSSAKNDEERKNNFEKMRKFCESFIKANGEIKRLYKFTGNNNWGTHAEGSGRLFADGAGIQGLPRKIRGFLLDGLTTDIDMVNAHPVILRYLCRLHNIKHDELDFYIENRDVILSEFPDRDSGKTLFLKATNDDKLNKKEKNLKFKAYDKEMKEIQKIITKLTCYEHIVADVPSNRLYNWYGSAINRIMCFFENKILQVIISELNRFKKNICAPMFDGLLLYGDAGNELKEILEDKINSEFSGLNMKLSFKEHAKDIVMPDSFRIPEAKPTLNETRTFEKVAAEFEKHHCKIINKAVFVIESECNNIVLSKQQLKTSYEHMTYEKTNKDGDIIKENFINAWLINNPSQRCFNDVGVYPPGFECPENHFNLWRHFAMENINEFEQKPDELAIILNHIKILCGNEESVFEYFIKWIAQMIQCPGVKSICPTLISNEGAGKGTLLKLLGKMLGDDKVYETTSPSRDVWGDFNGRMCNTFLINLNELSKKETVECEGRIKALITDPKLTINNKGINQYDIQSFHRFIITTNNSEPINTSKTDRRKLIIRSSDEKCGDKEYFSKLHLMLEDINVVKTCYEYFKSIPDVNNFNYIPMPETEYQSNLKELSESPIEQWLRDFTIENHKKESVELLGIESFTLFNEWLTERKIPYDINCVKLGVRLANMKISGIKKGRKTKKGDTKIYDITELKKHFKIGALVEFNNDKSELDDDDM